jgi:predicted ribosome quality control (RQC) complex YloA/Tae2 family protein
MRQIPFDVLTLLAVVREINTQCAGALVQQVQQPGAFDLGLFLYGDSGSAKILISAQPGSARMYLTQQRHPKTQNISGFCQVVRKHLDGARFLGITLPARDRVAWLNFVLPDKTPVYLVAELMGRNANIVLVTGKAQVIRGAIRPNAGERDLGHGEIYVNPPGLGSGDGLSPLARAEIAAGSFTEDELWERAKRGEFAPHSIMDMQGHTIGVWAFATKTQVSHPRENINIALDTFYATQAHQQTVVDTRTDIKRAFAREIAYRTKEKTSAERTLSESARAGEYNECGNLILAHMSQILEAHTRGADSVTVIDFYATVTNATRTIALDPQKSPQENAESYFARARKVLDAAEYADGRLADLEDELEQLTAVNPETDDIETLQKLLSNIAPPPKVAQKAAIKPYEGHKIRTFTLHDGNEWTLLVGETATANDYLLTRLASPSDIWMHVRGTTGAHGVLRTNGHPERASETILYKAAAIVAAKSGSAKHSSLVPVDVTERRYVRKPRGAKPGLAQYSQARTIDVKPELP